MKMNTQRTRRLAVTLVIAAILIQHGCMVEPWLVGRCGDGVRSELDGEGCDDGNYADGDGCSATCQVEACGNGVVDAAAGEVCDDGNVANGDSCSADCRSDETCGNGILDMTVGETCDDGNRIDGDGCSADCRSDETCGNGTLDRRLLVPNLDEECDDGNLMSDDGCSATCRLESCGDGLLDEGEVCDDGNTNPGDRCSPQCRIEMMVAAGGTQVCVLMDTGAVRCWGDGSKGQLGYGEGDVIIGDNETPADVGDIDLGGVAVAISAGALHTCALMDTGRVRCWGDGSSGQLGYGNTDRVGDDETPAQVGDIDLGGLATDISAGEIHTCAIMDTGAVRCWGDGLYGKLGYGNQDTIGDDEAPSSAGDVDLGGLAVQIEAGAWHTCALLKGGGVRCWGLNNVGRLGYNNRGGHIGDNETPASVGDVVLGGSAVHIAVGDNHTCALLADGGVRCWGGAFGWGQLGRGDTEIIGDDEFPGDEPVVDICGTVVQVAASRNHTCVRFNTGRVRCWGANENGQLGYGNTEDLGDDEPVTAEGEVSVGDNANQISVGAKNTCALLDTNEIRCWGFGETGQLGLGDPALLTLGDDELPSSAASVPYE